MDRSYNQAWTPIRVAVSHAEMSLDCSWDADVFQEAGGSNNICQLCSLFVNETSQEVTGAEIPHQMKMCEKNNLCYAII